MSRLFSLSRRIKLSSAVPFNVDFFLRQFRSLPTLRDLWLLDHGPRLTSNGSSFLQLSTLASPPGAASALPLYEYNTRGGLGILIDKSIFQVGLEHFSPHCKAPSLHPLGVLLIVGPLSPKGWTSGSAAFAPF